MGYRSAGDIFEIVDGSTLGTNVRMTLDSTGLFTFFEGVTTGVSHLLKRFHTTVTLDTGDAETDVGLTAGAVIMSAAIRVAGQITGLDSADHHIQLGINSNSTKYIDVAQGSAQTTIDVNIKDSYTFDTTVGQESAALVLTITGGSDNIPSGGSVEVEIIYLDSANLADV